MRPKSLLLLGLALGCGLVASIGISQVMDRNANPSAKIDTAPVYVAKHNINLGDPINNDMVAMLEWPKDKIPRGAIAKLDELEGRRPRTAIFEGEPILEAKLLAPGQVANPISSIPKNMRLKTIAVDAEKSAAGLLGPGDRVDVQLFVRPDQRTGIDRAKSKIILQNIRIFAVDQTVQRAADGADERSIAKTVSLMLTPEQASKLALAERIGEISLIPRNPDDDSIAAWNEYTMDDLMADGEKSSRKQEQGLPPVAAAEANPADNSTLSSAISAAAPETPPPFKMEIVEAQDVREVAFDAKTGKPIRDAANPTGAAPASPTGIPGAGGLTPGDSDKLDDFPIDFNARR